MKGKLGSLMARAGKWGIVIVLCSFSLVATRRMAYVAYLMWKTKL